MPVLNPVTNQVGGGEQFPEGEYEFELTFCDYWTNPNPSEFDNDRPQLVWKLRAVAALDTDDGGEQMIGKEIWRFSGDTMGLKQDGSPTIARETVQAFLGRDLEEGEEPDTDELIGKRARGEVGRTRNGKHKVTRMRRSTRRVSNANPAQKRQATADENDPWDADE